MVGPLYGTEIVAHELTFTRGDETSVTHVGVYYDVDPNASPEPAAVVGEMAGDFHVVTLVPGTGPLAEATKIDVAAVIGPKAGADFDIVGPPDDYQLWVLVATATEDIVRKTGTLTVA